MTEIRQNYEKVVHSCTTFSIVKTGTNTDATDQAYFANNPDTYLNHDVSVRTSQSICQMLTVVAPGAGFALVDHSGVRNLDCQAQSVESLEYCVRTMISI